jgi:hypothetical protein
MDPLEEKIRSCHARLEELAESVIELAIGNLEKNLHGAPPRVTWEEQGGETRLARGGGGAEAEGAELEAEFVRFAIALWFEDVATCRERKDELKNAIRLEWGPANYQMGPYDAVSQHNGAWEHAGKLFTLMVSVRYAVPLMDPRVTPRTIEGHQGTITMEDVDAIVTGGTAVP